MAASVAGSCVSARHAEAECGHRKNVCSNLVQRSSENRTFGRSDPGPLCCGSTSSFSYAKRKSSVIEATMKATDSIQRTDPLTKKDLTDYLASGCAPKDKWRIGTEHEKLGFDLETLKPLSYKQIAMLLECIAGRYNWDRIVEDGMIFGLKKDCKSITLEGGGQLELSGAPLANLHETSAEISSHLSEVNDAANELGIGFLGCGFEPKWPIAASPIIPQEKIKVMRDCFQKSGSTGCLIMRQSGSVQVNLDFSSENDMVDKYRIGLALQPVSTALFSNSPFAEGKPNGFLSYRSHLYMGLDDKRTGMLPFVFADDFGFEKYVEYALDTPMYYIHHNNRVLNCFGMSFRDYIAGKLPMLPGVKATLEDWGYHLVQLYGEVRLKGYLEMRGSDVGPARQSCAVPAFWVGLLYDETSLQAALKLIADWTPEELQMLREKVPRLGLETPLRDSPLIHVAQDVVKLAKEGLQRRRLGEDVFLDQASEIARTGITPAQTLLDLYENKWNRSIDPIYRELQY